MELATIRKPMFKHIEGEGDTLILLHTDRPMENLIRNILFEKMLGRAPLHNRPK